MAEEVSAMAGFEAVIAIEAKLAEAFAAASPNYHHHLSFGVLTG